MTVSGDLVLPEKVSAAATLVSGVSSVDTGLIEDCGVSFCFLLVIVEAEAVARVGAREDFLMVLTFVGARVVVDVLSDCGGGAMAEVIGTSATSDEPKSAVVAASLTRLDLSPDDGGCCWAVKNCLYSSSPGIDWLKSKSKSIISSLWINSVLVNNARSSSKLVYSSLYAAESDS